MSVDDQEVFQTVGVAIWKLRYAYWQVATVRRAETDTAKNSRRRYTDVPKVCRMDASDTVKSKEMQS